MNVAWLSLIALLVAVTLSMVSKVNVGIVSLAKIARTENEALAGRVVKSLSRPRDQ